MASIFLKCILSSKQQNDICEMLALFSLINGNNKFLDYSLLIPPPTKGIPFPSCSLLYPLIYIFLLNYVNSTFLIQTGFIYELIFLFTFQSVLFLCPKGTYHSLHLIISFKPELGTFESMSDLLFFNLVIILILRLYKRKCIKFNQLERRMQNPVNQRSLIGQDPIVILK